MYEGAVNIVNSNFPPPKGHPSYKNKPLYNEEDVFYKGLLNIPFHTFGIDGFIYEQWDVYGFHTTNYQYQYDKFEAPTHVVILGSVFNSRYISENDCIVISKNELDSFLIKQSNSSGHLKKSTDEDEAQELHSKEKTSLLKLIGVLTQLYANDKNRLNKDRGINIAQVTADVLDYAASESLDSSGLSERTVKSKLPEALKALDKK